jgi:OOP family OmpA-OmpF porin
MNKFLCFILIAAAAMPLAQADDFYVGASINPGARGHIRYSDAGVVHDVDAGARKFSGSVFAGYVLSPSWALEAGYRGIGDDNRFKLTQGYDLKTRTHMGYLAVRNTWQLGEDWSLYGKVGVAQGRLTAGIEGKDVSGSEKVKKNGLYLGLGAAYAINKDVSLQLELEHSDKLKLQGLSATMDRFSLGVRVGF